MSDLLVVGCDPSSKKLAFVAMYALDHVYVRTYQLRKQNSRYTPQACCAAKYACEALVDELARCGNPVTRQLYVEAPYTGVSPLSTNVQAFVSGVIQACFVHAGYDVQLVPPSTWKHEVCGSGAATKEQVRATIRSRWANVYDLAGGDQDVLDAAALALYGDAVVHR